MDNNGGKMIPPPHILHRKVKIIVNKGASKTEEIIIKASGGAVICHRL